MAAAKMLFC